MAVSGVCSCWAVFRGSSASVACCLLLFHPMCQHPTKDCFLGLSFCCLRGLRSGCIVPVFGTGTEKGLFPSYNYGYMRNLLGARSGNCESVRLAQTPISCRRYITLSATENVWPAWRSYSSCSSSSLGMSNSVFMNRRLMAMTIWRCAKTPTRPEYILLFAR